MSVNFSAVAEVLRDSGMGCSVNNSKDGLFFNFQGLEFEMIPNVDSEMKDFFLIQKVNGRINVVLANVHDFQMHLSNMALYYLLSSRLEKMIEYSEALKLFKALNLQFESTDENKLLLNGLTRVSDLDNSMGIIFSRAFDVGFIQSLRNALISLGKVSSDKKVLLSEII